MLTLDGLNEPAPAAVLKELTDASRLARGVADAYWQNESNRPPSSVTSRLYDREQVGREWKASGLKGSAMFTEAAEVRMFTAERRRLLAEHGFDDSPFPHRLSLKAQPGRLGALLIATFLDRLSCVDPKRWVDAYFVPEAEMLEAWWIFYAPKLGLKRWLCWFPCGTEPVFPPRSEPPLTMVL